MPPPPRPHALARSALADRANDWLATSWAKGWLSFPPLDAESLLAKAGQDFVAANEIGGRSREDVDDFQERLTRLCHSVEHEARLNSLGRAIAHGQIVRVIRQRLGLGKLWQAQPEMLHTPLAPPIIVVGQMRAGTTRLHRLLAADPAHCATRFCDSWQPVPGGAVDLRPLWSGMALFMARRMDPWIDTLHPFGAARADEELGWLASALDHGAYEAQWHIPSFTAFSEARGAVPVYREFARILRTDAAYHGNAALPRVMKVPQFAEDLPALLAQFPDARLVIARRDHIDVTQSSASLVANQMTMQSDDVDLPWIEREWQRKIALRSARMDAALAAFAGPVAQVEFADINRDCMGAISGVYDALGLELTQAARTAMEAELAQASQSAHHHHQEMYQGFASGEA